MIVPTYHHAHYGTHDAEALAEWADGVGWFPLSGETILADVAAGGIIIGKANTTWVRNSERISVTTICYRHGYSENKMREAGWTMVDLYCLGSITNMAVRDIGVRCRCCRDTLPAEYMNVRPTQWNMDVKPTCRACDALASRAMAGHGDAFKIIKTRSDSMAKARAAVRNLRAAIEAGSRSKVRMLDQIRQAEWALGVKS